MKIKNVLIAALPVVCIALAAALFVYTRNKPAQPEPTTAPVTEVTTQEQVADITLALSEYRAFLNWKAAENADGYYVYYDTGDGWTEYGKATINSFRNKNLKGGTTYTFGIKPFKLDGENEVLDEEMLYTIRGNTLPDTPQCTVTKDGRTCSIEWKAVNNADEYIVYSMLPGDSEWTRQGITKDTAFRFDTENVETLFTAVRAVRYADGEKFVSDYIKTLVSDVPSEGKMYSCGDSIATGVGSHSYSYANIFAEEHNLTLVNKATTGSQIASSDPKKDHIAENIIKDVSSDYDYLFIEGGNNDYYFGAPLGKVTKEGTKEFDMNTTCGALEAALSHLQKNCPKTKVVFIIIHNAGGRATTPNDIGLTFGDYAEGIRAVCEKYGVDVADCLADGKLNTQDVALSDKYTHKFNGVFPTGDGVHPTEEAYREFYMPLIEQAAK